MKKRFTPWPCSIMLLTTLAGGLRAQELPAPQYRSWQNPETGQLYWNKNLPAYLFIGASPQSSEATPLHSESMPQYAQPFYFDTEGINRVRSQWAVDTATRRTVIPQREILWEVYADGLPPQSKVAFTEGSRLPNGTQLLGPASRVEITARDAVSGVETIRYALNTEPYAEYTAPFIPQGEGSFTLSVCAEDHVGNREQPQQHALVVDLTPPQSSCVVTGVHLGRNTVALSSVIVLEATDKITDVSTTFYRIDGGAWVKYPKNTKIPIDKLSDGEHKLEFYSTDLLGNNEELQAFDFYLDATAPITISDILGDKFLVGDKMFFSGRTKMKITAVDNRAGVKGVLYSINNGEFVPYEDAFYMPNTQGWHTVKYYSIDSTENRTQSEQSQNFYEYRMKVDKVFVDLTGPTISHTLTGPHFTRNDTSFVSVQSIVTLRGSDPESGFNYLAYSIDGDAWEKRYEAPFDLNGLASGEHTVEYFGYDNVNNRNIGKFSFILDSDPPRVDYQLSVSPTAMGNDTQHPVYPIDATVYLVAQDNMTGVHKLEYSINRKPMREYTKPFGELERGTNRLRIRATDMVGNTTEVQLQFEVR